jgi:IclR family transcriptional regulator, pca regulon regulatory protein
MAAPIHDASGRVVAAVNVSAHAARTTLAQMREQLLPPLRDTAHAISRDVARIAPHR